MCYIRSFILIQIYPALVQAFLRIVLYCIVVGTRRLMPPDAPQPTAYCTNPGLQSFLLAPPGVTTRDPSSERRNYLGEKWPMNFAWKYPTSTNIQVSFTCRKYTTGYKRLYFPSEGRRAEDFFALKNPTGSVGFELANLGTKGQHATSRPPKPLVF